MARWQLMGRGWSREEIAWRLRTGRIHRVHAGVYSTAPLQLLSRQGWWMAAVLASGPDALLSHWSAAAFWQIRPSSRGRVDVTVSHRSRSSREIYRHLAKVPPDERVVSEGTPVTSVHRTIFDLAAAASVDEVAAMIKEAEYLELWDRLSFWDLLERYPG
ncbi:MAG: type IV toxin-antitoxin system AbiEi family antitoxin domain-containing protein, partial [Solirubrobacterales bacterium]